VENMLKIILFFIRKKVFNEEGATEKASKYLVKIERKAYRNIEMTFEYHSVIGYL
jgi:hypothetical protein